MLGAQIVEASNQLHNALLAHKVVDYNHTRRPTTGNTVTKVIEPTKLPARPCLSRSRPQLSALRLKSRKRKPIRSNIPK
jgi:hypothetical protein